MSIKNNLKLTLMIMDWGISIKENIYSEYVYYVNGEKFEVFLHKLHPLMVFRFKNKITEIKFDDGARKFEVLRDYMMNFLELES